VPQDAWGKPSLYVASRRMSEVVAEFRTICEGGSSDERSDPK
jgi:hypothetical protein